MVWSRTIIYHRVCVMNGSVLEGASAQQSTTRADNLFALLAKLAKAIAILASAGAVALHLIGYVAQQSYLRAFNVDPDGFPRTMDWMLIFGYYSVLDVGVFVFNNSNRAKMAMIFVFLFIFTVIFRWTPKRKKRPAWVVRLSRIKGVKFLIFNVLMPAISILAVYPVFIISLLIAIVPAAMGESVGNRAARANIVLYGDGCTMDNPCSQIWMSGGLVAKGFVIATSADRVAFYDVDMGMVRQLERSSLELRTAIDPKSAPVKAKQTMSGSDAPCEPE